MKLSNSPLILLITLLVYALHFFPAQAQHSDTLIALVESPTNGILYYIDQKGNIIINKEKGNAHDFSDDLLRKDVGGYGFVNWKNEWVIEPTYFAAENFSDGLSRVRNFGNEWGYIDKKGKLVIPMQFAAAWDFENGMAGVRINGLWGFIDTTGNVVIKAQYKNINPFKNGYAAVKMTNDQWSQINKKGQIITTTQPQYTYMAACADNRIRVRLTTKEGRNWWGYRDTLGISAIMVKYIQAEDFSEGLARVRESKDWGYIDVNGNYIIKPQFDFCSDFKDGMARVMIKDKWGIINKKGEWLVQPRFEMIREIVEGIAAASDGNNWGYIDTKGNWIIQPYYKMAKDFVRVKIN
ncbi:MAG TPA: WG repeat-containing protein [Cytophagales bacterium]|nr:WG repeat-containing protein [Cytophagales bacterium]